MEILNGDFEWGFCMGFEWENLNWDFERGI